MSSLARNTVLSLLPQAVGIGVGTLSSIVTARYLGPSGRGALAVINVTVALLALLANLGLSYSLTFFVAKGRLSEQQAMGFSLIASLAVGIPFSIVALAGMSLLSTSLLRGVDPLITAIAIIALPALLFVNFWTTVRLARRDFGYIARFQSVTTLLGFAIVVAALMLFRVGLAGLIIANTVASFLYAAYALLGDVRKTGATFSWPRGTIKEIAAYGARVYAGSLVNYGYLRLDTYILNAFSGTASVGLYSTAVTLNEKLWVLDSAISQAVLPDVVAREEKDAARLAAFTARTNLVLGGAVALSVGIATPWLIPFLYGQAFAGAVVPLLLLLPGTAAYGASRSLAQYISGQRGRPGLTSGLALFIALLSVAVYLALVPPLGAVGAALGSTAVYTVNLLALLALFVRESTVSLTSVLMPTREDFSVYRDVFKRALRKAGLLPS